MFNAASIVLVCVLCLTASGCGKPRRINGIKYDTIGLIDYVEGDVDPCIRYKASFGNIFWTIVLFDTIAAPIYFVGWSILNPVGVKPICEKKARGN